MKTVQFSDLFPNLIVGWDPGYGHGKAELIMPMINAGPYTTLDQIQDDGDNLCAFQAPNQLWYVVDISQSFMCGACKSSVTGVGTTDLGLLSDLSLTRGHKAVMPDRVRFGKGFNYLVGEGVGFWAEEEQRMDFNRLTASPQLSAVFYDVLDALLAPKPGDSAADRVDLREWVKAGGVTLTLMVGLPVEVMMDRSVATETLKTMRKWMVGEHTFEVNDATTNLTIADVSAMAQPAGTFFAWGLDNRGEWARNPADFKAPVAVCDIGLKTLDLFSIVGGRVHGRFTGGDTAGMARAAQMLIDLMQQEYGIEGVSLHAADTLIHSKNPTRWVPGGREIDLAPLVEQALARATAGIIDFLDKKWGKGSDFAYILFTGGGAATLRAALTNKYPSGDVLPDPVMANAIGLARYGQRQWRKK